MEKSNGPVVALIPRVLLRLLLRVLILSVMMAAIGGVFYVAVRPWYLNWGATAEERMKALPGDEIVGFVTRGRGITLQKFKQGGLADAKLFTLDQGLEVRTGAKTRIFTKAEIKDWIGQRAQAGRLPPNGFPRSGKF